MIFSFRPFQNGLSLGLRCHFAEEMESVWVEDLKSGLQWQTLFMLKGG